MFGEFKGFLIKTNALALAVGVVIGGALGTVVNSLVNDVIMPPIGMALGGVDFSSLKIVLKAVNAIIAFIIIAFVVWQISKMFIKEEVGPDVKTCPFCKEPNAIDASKCKACTSAI